MAIEPRGMNMENESKEIETSQETSMSNYESLIRLAIEKDADIDKIEKLIVLKERYEAGEAKKSFVRSLSAFKADVPVVTKDKVNSQYSSKYVSLSNLVNTISPTLSHHGFSASWDIEQNGIIKVTCKITHAQGHSESSSMSANADKSGAKNDVQQIKSTITYLKSVTFESILGIASSDANLDDDGQLASEAGKVATALVTKAQVSNLLDLIDNSERVDKTKFLSYMKVEKIEDILKSNFNKALIALGAK